jgi:hypothetical protein
MFWFWFVKYYLVSVGSLSDETISVVADALAGAAGKASTPYSLRIASAILPRTIAISASRWS